MTGRQAKTGVVSRAEWKTGRMEEWKKNELSSVCVCVCVCMYVSTELDVRLWIIMSDGEKDERRYVSRWD